MPINWIMSINDSYISKDYRCEIKITHISEQYDFHLGSHQSLIYI